MKPLHELAKLNGIYLSYTSAFGKRKTVPDSTLFSILSAMGLNPDNEHEIKKEINSLKKEKIIEPVTVAWGGVLPLPINTTVKNLEFELVLENKKVYSWKLNTESLPEANGKKMLQLADSLPYGYHKLHVYAGSKKSTTLIISAPVKAYSTQKSHLGFFAPLYALQSETSEGIGDFKDMEKMFDWVKKYGDVFSTLPLTSIFIDPYNEISPYSPATLQFWNELYINIEDIPEFNKCKSRRILNQNKQKTKELNRQRNVDYNSVYKIKRKVLEAMANEVFSRKIRKKEFTEFVKKNPGVKKYAWYRAKKDISGESKKSSYRYYLYSQWKAHEQVDSVASKAKEKGVKLKFDFPVGVHPQSFEAHNNSTYLQNVQIGAPPDPNFHSGQNWGFPPPQPEIIRENGYVNFIRAIQKQMRFASFLRIDHIMGLHRLFWIPANSLPGKGTYVQYNPDEFYAILCLESQRNKCALFGENLGTVPSYVNKKMKKHNIGGFSVFLFLINGLPSISKDNVACLNTHDTPTFAGFLEAKDIKEAGKKGFMDEKQEKRKIRDRNKSIDKLIFKLKQKKLLKKNTKKELLYACIRYLLENKPSLVLVNTEDLWLERKQQNKPATISGNWKQKLKYTLDNLPELLDLRK